jgi:hypothetical protein
MKWRFTILCLLIASVTPAQEQPASPVYEQQLENQAERQEGITEDDTQWQQLEYLQKHPLNLNEANEDALKELHLLTDIQISNFLSYRKLLGPLMNVYELQAIPGWDIITIKQLLPFVTVNNQNTINEKPGKRFIHGTHTLLLRLGETIDKSAAYLKTTNNYLGSPLAVMFRYKYNYKNLLQYGITGDKDAGEQFFKGAQKNGFDFYSFHLFARKLGIIQSLAIGDFTVHLGQGLIQWQGMSFKKSADVLNVKKQSPVLQPYNSAGEYNFHRGAGITLQKGHIECTLFGSLRKFSSTLVTDSVNNSGTYISSILTSGYNRSATEISHRNNIQCITAGGNIKMFNNRGHIGFNAVKYNLSKPLKPSGEPYDAFSIDGSQWSNYSIDYSYTLRNVHLYGEVAADKLYNRAMIQGVLASLDPKVDLALLYRNISSKYQSMFSNAFTENSLPVNENGWYTGISIRPVAAWKLDVYADIFHFPWLKYQVNAPSGGHEYLLQLTYTPNKYAAIYSRVRYETKSANVADSSLTIEPVLEVPKINWRTQISYRLNNAVQLRSRVETVWYANTLPQQKETGFIFFTDVHVKPSFKPYSFSGRLQYVETGGYNSRLYAWENTVMYNFSVPASFGKFFRYMVNVNYNIGNKNVAQHNKHASCMLSFSYAGSVYTSKTTVDAQNPAIDTPGKTSMKLQVIFTSR